MRVGVYADNPAQALQALKRSAGSGITVMSAYLTAGKSLPPSLISAANTRQRRAARDLGAR